MVPVAHHARKNHPYNQILRDFYYTCDPDHRPRVFGMTASPVWHPRNAYISLRTLEQNLHSKVLGVLENKTELLEHSPRPIEVGIFTPNGHVCNGATSRLFVYTPLRVLASPSTLCHSGNSLSTWSSIPIPS